MDFTKAIYLVNRKMLITKLENMIGTKNPLTITVNLLTYNKVRI